MRNLSAFTLAKLAQKLGNEPIVIVEISWADDLPNFIYGDRTFLDLGIQGRILNVKSLDDAINYGMSGTVQNVSLTLDDSDGVMKEIFNAVDVHRRPVWIYQWFSDIPYNERFLLFSGVIASPITWKESDRTLDFEILSKVIDNEVGFSVEDGDFPYVPMEIIGKAWPLIFGTAMQVPALRIDALPHGQKVGSAINSVLQHPFGIHDPSLDKKIKGNNLTSAFCRELSIAYFIDALIASEDARIAGELGFLDQIETGTGPLSKLSVQLQATGNKLLKQAHDIDVKSQKLNKVLGAQKLFEEQKIGITNGELFPTNQTLSLNIGGALVTGYFNSTGGFITLSTTHPNAEITSGLIQDPIDSRVGDPVITRDKMFFANAGTPVFHYDNILGEEVGVIPIRYILACQIPVNVISLSAYRTVPVGLIYGQPGPSFRGLYPIPSNLYTIYQVDFGSITVTVALFGGPLSSRGEGWEDEIFATMQSAAGPNVVDIIVWLIENYTLLGFDPVSFTEVRALVDQFPANFALVDRPEAIKLIQDIAYQSKCIVYLKNGIFYIKYLAQQDVIVDTLTEDDIILSSLSVESTETENLVTKYIATWEPDYLGTNLFKVILRYNINKYGLQEKTYKYFIYNQQILVDIAATFWMIRTANSYKIVKFRTPISKLNIETLDTIVLNFSTPIIGNGPIPGIVQKASFDSAKFEIEFEVWTPVRLGEMSPYPFFYTAEISEQDVFPTQYDIDHGNVAVTGVTIPTAPILSAPFSGDQGNGGVVQGKQVASRGLTNYKPGTNNIQPEIDTRIDNSAIQQTPPLPPPDDAAAAATADKPDQTEYYQYDSLPDPATAVVPNLVDGTFPAMVTGGSGNLYTLDVYFNGLNRQSTSIQNVKQLQIDPSDTISNGTWCLAVRSVTSDGSGHSTTKYYMQVPVWGIDETDS